MIDDALVNDLVSAAAEAIHASLCDCFPTPTVAEGEFTLAGRMAVAAVLSTFVNTNEYPTDRRSLLEMAARASAGG